MNIVTTVSAEMDCLPSVGLRGDRHALHLRVLSQRGEAHPF